MSEIDLDAIQTRATMATRGPWHVEWDGTGYPQRVFNDAAVLVAETCTGPEWPPTDAEFIAHARTDVPALLARIAELEPLAAENARLRQDRDSWRLVAERLQGEINEATEAMTALAPSSLEDERDRLQARLDTATAHVEELRGQRDFANERAEFERRVGERLLTQNIAMRPVVEAAEAWRDSFAGETHDHPRNGLRLADAVDAWRAAQPDQSATWRKAKSEDENAGALIPGEGDVAEEPTAQGGAQGEESWYLDALGSQGRKGAPADPAGLDAAIKAGARTTLVDGFDVPTIVRAAAPHLRAAALNEAADAAVEHHHYQSCALDASTWLRERAGRETS